MGRTSTRLRMTRVTIRQSQPSRSPLTSRPSPRLNQCSRADITQVTCRSQYARPSASARYRRHERGRCSHRAPGRDRWADAHTRALRGMPRRPHYRLVAARLRLLIATTTMTTMTPTRSRASPTLWRLNPDECTDVANLKITPTTASTIPIAISQIPDLVFTDPQPSLLAVRGFARTHRQDGALAAA
jgi:hypothetical protein